MAKITAHGGPSNAAEVVAVVVAAAAEEHEHPGLGLMIEAVNDDVEPAIEVPDEVAEFVSEVDDVPVAPGTPYDTWLLVDLQDELVTRGLPKSGNKPELVQRLIDDDNLTGGPEPADADVEADPAF